MLLPVILGGRGRAGFAALLVLCASHRMAAADCTAQAGVHLNEVRCRDARLPEGGLSRADPLVELFNKGATAIPIGGWTIRDPNASVLATLPGTLVLPPAAFLEVVMGSGPDDLGFASGIGT